ncbi:hypothetical protein V5E97_29585 [Singulisphaera sp. Ch08]|uniref:Uncharacterized protein n=1 Tax=Singulisphaera sp. Ch08 TaxID=3120278 RepID=A0AAU7CBS1_9BACT
MIELMLQIKVVRIMDLRIIAFCIATVGCVLITGVSVPAQAISEDSRSNGGRWSSGLYSTRDFLERNGPHVLLDLPMIRKELRITAAQSSELEAMQTKVRGFENAPSEISLKDTNGFDVNNAVKAKILMHYNQKQIILSLGTSQILGPAQNRRLKEICLQLEGVLAVARPEIQEALNMDQSQKLNVEEIKRKYDQSKITIYRKNTAIIRKQRVPTSKAEADKLQTSKQQREARNKEFDRHKAEFDSMRERTEAQIKRWLTRRQEEKFKKLCGAPFEELEKMSVPGLDWKR